ncbi:SIR2 family NAD-dependent protein deacylase [Erysipelothrix aquatica]|uniref:SIR2 family NAD-dependent protein deacylase n=1 Tax=Erysipelothrix aquatica TaxID=2683714 RepID=UPI00135A1171|nr:Sir2 family NAD-dependent protein deacetylase [Erysipelothrix aquatica]
MILAFTGAGISKDSGINTFMEMPEVRDRLYRTFATAHPQAYQETIRDLVNAVKKAKPNDAHRALAEYKIPIITMNIDGLHERAGSTQVLEVHGVLPSEDEIEYAHELFHKPVLYGDPAPNYAKAIQKVSKLKSGDILLVVGASRYTQIAVQIREIAYMNGASIIEIQDDATSKVRDFLSRNA